MYVMTSDDPLAGYDTMQVRKSTEVGGPGERGNDVDFSVCAVSFLENRSRNPVQT